MPYVPQSQEDQTFLAQAIELSRHALEDEGKTPSEPSSSSTGKSSPPAPVRSSNSGIPPLTPKSWLSARQVRNSDAISWKTP